MTDCRHGCLPINTVNAVRLEMTDLSPSIFCCHILTIFTLSFDRSCVRWPREPASVV